MGSVIYDKDFTVEGLRQGFLRLIIDSPPPLMEDVSTNNRQLTP